MAWCCNIYLYIYTFHGTLAGNFRKQSKYIVSGRELFKMVYAIPYTYKIDFTNFNDNWMDLLYSDKKRHDNMLDMLIPVALDKNLFSSVLLIEEAQAEQKNDKCVVSFQFTDTQFTENDIVAFRNIKNLM